MDLEVLYSYLNEDERLSTKAASIEFLTTRYYIEKYLKPEMKILDIGAGTGAYSIYYAKQGYDVTAIELVNKHVEIIKSKATEDMKLQALQGNALDLSRFSDNSFDIVLCLGPLYHFENDEGKLQCIKEAKRVCKKGGVIVYAYISNDMVIITESALYNPKFLGSTQYDHDSFKVKDQPFCFLTVEHMINLMKNIDLELLHHLAADGLAELLSDKINEFDDEQFREWFRFHLYSCEKPYLFGYSNHILYIGKK